MSWLPSVLAAIAAIAAAIAAVMARRYRIEAERELTPRADEEQQ